MTSPASYVFYGKHDKKARIEGARLVRIFVTEDKLTIFSKQVVRAQKSGVLFEKMLDQQTLSVHTNAHGQKYLKRQNKSPTGSIKDTSLCGDAFYLPEMEAGYSELVKSTLLDWFNDHPYLVELEELPLKELIEELLFHLQAAPYFIYNPQVMKLFAELQSQGYPVTRTLRESESWDAFLLKLCSAVESAADLAFLNDHFLDLLPLAVLPLGETLTSLKTQHSTQDILQCSRSFTGIDRNLIHFMLKYSPKEERGQIVERLMELVVFHRKVRLGASDIKSWSWFSTSDKRSLNEIPSKLRPELARRLHDILEALSSEVKNKNNWKFRASMIETDLELALHCWYARHVFEPRMKTDRSIEDVRSRFRELFGEHPWNDVTPSQRKVRWTVTPAGAVFCSFPRRYSASPATTDLLVHLEGQTTKGRPKPTGRGLNAYFYGEEFHRPRDEDFYSVEEVLAIIEAGVKAIDSELTRLGRPLTPENRVSYLLADPKERRFKNTWKYYDAGVKDVSKVLALKKSGVKNKKDIQMYDALPDEMFYELLSLESGRELSRIGGL